MYDSIKQRQTKHMQHNTHRQNDIIGLSLLRNDVNCHHFKGASLTPCGRAPVRAGTGRILGFWAFAAGRSLAKPVIRLWWPDFSWPGRAWFKA